MDHDEQISLHLARCEWKRLVDELGNMRRLWDSAASQSPAHSDRREYCEVMSDQVGRWERALLGQLALAGMRV